MEKGAMVSEIYETYLKNSNTEALKKEIKSLTASLNISGRYLHEDLSRKWLNPKSKEGKVRVHDELEAKKILVNSILEKRNEALSEASYG